MATAIKDERAARPRPADPSPTPDADRVREIISRGRRSRSGALAAVGLGLSTAGLMWAAFPPLDWGPLAWLSLVPLLLLVAPRERAGWTYRAAFLSGCAFWIASLQWMRLGDPTMVTAWLALAVYLASYWPLFIWLARTAVLRWRMPLVVAAPLLWTGLEYLRGHLLTGFSWYQLAHSQHGWVDVIQVSDLFGGYAVTFIVVAGNAALAELVPVAWFKRAKLVRPDELAPFALGRTLRGQGRGVLLAVGLVLFAQGYGLVRRPEQFPLGPRVGLVQGNFVASLRVHDDPLAVDNMHRQLTGFIVTEQPDVIVWPEAMYVHGLLEVDPGVTDEQLAALDTEIPATAWRNTASQKHLADLAEATNAALIFGTLVRRAGADDYQIYNSAVLTQPGIGVSDRYDKIHRVPFGEYIPLRDQVPALQALTPYRGKFGIDAGESGQVFRFKDWRFIPTICFEDTVPHLVRNLAAAGKVNDSLEGGAVLVNISNDGWFHGSSELEQHLISSQFRAIETRTPMVRAANTGISAVIDGDGVVRDPALFFDADLRAAGQPRRTSLRDPQTGKFHKQLNCAQVVDVPLDPRQSFYVATGDWFAGMCLAGCFAVGLGGLAGRRGRGEALSA